MERCEYCGADVDPGDYEDIGGHRVWICGSAKCHRELQRDALDAYEHARSDAMERFEDEWGY